MVTTQGQVTCFQSRLSGVVSHYLALPH